MNPVKNNPLKKALYYLSFLSVYLPVYLLGLLPLSVSKGTLGKMLYFLSYRIFRYRYNVVLQNLSRALPTKSYAEIQQISKDFYRHLSLMILETTRLFSISSSSLLKKVTLSNVEMVMDYYEQKRNIIAVLGHYGNWEYLNILPAYLPFNVNAIYKPLSNPVMGKLIHHIRGRFGMRLIPANQALRYLLKQKDQPQMSLFIADQFPGINEDTKFDFLHQSTNMFNGAEKLSIATDAVVVYIDIKRKPDNCWEVGFSLITDAAKQTEEQQITRCFADKLQETIKAHPAYWLWSHKRWKVAV
ncbi:KDO2-lipid IV(A) lauroyltransferase [Pedobacter caeni]|uniref:KDO2-lipid IV(A) lauroyltransferase n=1 Tax=Pedobacter caeni TaxID=288992 RepID=A0A1M5HKW7_9SPHI|nr:KDO2-lipid IV(A) lauroyltransferase [Pedobacter caeni]